MSAADFRYIKSAAETWASLASVQQDGPASCVKHRRQSSGGCIHCGNDRATARYATERFCDLMRQGIWKGRL